MATFLTTGASRGFGLALARELAFLSVSEISKVIASARGDVSALYELAQTSSDRVVIVKLDVIDQAFIKKAAAEVERKLRDKKLDVLINNSGICQYAFESVKSMPAFLCSKYIRKIDRLNILRYNLEEKEHHEEKLSLCKIIIHFLSSFLLLTKIKFNHSRPYLASSCERRSFRLRLQGLESDHERSHRPVCSRSRKGRLYIHDTLSRRICPFPFACPFSFSFSFSFSFPFPFSFSFPFPFPFLPSHPRASLSF